jgi:hypothetical protein
MFATVAVPFDALQPLPPLEFKVMTALLRYADRAGRCWPALRQLAVDVGKSEATVCRAMKRLADDWGCFDERSRAGNGRYRYRIAARFLPRWPRVQDGLAQPARQEALPRKQLDSWRFAKFEKVEEGLPAPVEWGPRLRSYRKSGFWLEVWGPRPGEAGCFAPMG